MTTRFLINIDGTPFESSEIQKLREELDSLGDDERTKYRDQNASAIAGHDAVKVLIVSGPGTGKSQLFLNKIDHWYQKDGNASVLVTSFVRKLVVDLQNDIKGDKKLTDAQRGKIMVLTLHGLARSIVERNHGTIEWPYRRHLRIIGQNWKKVVWGDVLAFYPTVDRDVFAWRQFEQLLHDNNFEQAEEWKGTKDTYFKLCQFYNATGFADLILRATQALTENPGLNEYDHFIIDEYQDFNLAEESLANQFGRNPKGLLVVGDDEQILYETLKSSKPTLIRGLYKNTNYAKGMLAFCSRSSFHITKTANHFIQQDRETGSIEKIYLPLKTTRDDSKVQIIACATKATAVDYIAKFVADYKAEIDERKRQLEVGAKKDAFLLILTPAKEVNFYVDRKFNGKGKFDELVSEYKVESRAFSEDYYQLLNYYSLSLNPNNNFTFRKVLHYQMVSEATTHELIAEAIRDGKNLCDLDAPEIKDALDKCNTIKTILDAKGTVSGKLAQIFGLINVTNQARLGKEIEQKAIGLEEVEILEHDEEEEAELEEIEVKKMGAIELMTIVGSKGLSAEHVIIIGFDDANMKYIAKNAFYVALTRARRSLHILTALKSGGATRAHNFLSQLPDDHLEFYKYKKEGHTKSLLGDRQDFMNYLDKIYRVSSRPPKK